MLHVAARTSGAVTVAAIPGRRAAFGLTRRNAGLPRHPHTASPRSVTSTKASEDFSSPAFINPNNDRLSGDQQSQNDNPGFRLVKLETRAPAVRRAESKLRRYEVIKFKANETQRSLTSKHVDMKDWNVAYQLLLDHTPTNPEAFKKHLRIIKINTPKGSAPLFGDMSQSLLTLQLQTGAQVWALPDAPIGTQYLALNGFLHQIEVTIAQLAETYSSIESIPEDQCRSLLDTHPTRARSTVNWSIRSEDTLRNRTLSEIPAPEVMTVNEFANYVQDILLTKPPRLKLRTESKSLGGTDTSHIHHQHQQRVSQILVALFKTEKLRSCWSLKASEMALQYLGKHRLFPQAKMILHELDQFAGADRLEIYDFFLEGPSTAQDLKNFQYGLEVMIRKGGRPSPQTWILFLRMLKKYDMSICQHVIKEMRSRHMFGATVTRVRAMHVIASVEYQKWFESGGTPEAFLEHFATSWDISNKILGLDIIWELLMYHLHRAQFAEVEVLLNKFISDLSGKPVSVKVLDLCIKNAKRHGNVEAAVKLCKLIIPRTSGHLNATTYNYLFWLAWERKYLCLVNILWRYGCLAGHISYTTSSIMRGSILSSPHASINLLDLVNKTDDAIAAPTPHPGTYVPQDPTTLVPSNISRQGVFNKIAAVVSIGLQMGVVEGKNSMESRGKSPVYMNKQQRLAVMKQDMETGGNYRTDVPLEVMLEEAYNRDLEMKRKGFPSTLAGVVDMCPQLPLLEKRSAGSADLIKAKNKSTQFYTSVHEALTGKKQPGKEK
ncbi:hypothetical protein BDZ85DRAFT_260460 [Elsinoe ampelina]|uniref:Pentatricopeptide repeat domain-containing protein n=1 Tax=Elsinoe ampelina TaxID=302913 RepID=A0A6A6GEQ2_9PEZI|nr:hypothetical protein BDZ85DRAFT_260460 [Elsinoe ampelina]